jgi:putative transposase
MTQSKMYKRHRFPPEITQYTAWLYHRFTLGHRDIEDFFRQRAFASWEKAVAM